MRKVTLVSLWLIGSLWLLSQQGFAQSVAGKVELGAQFTTTRISDNGFFQDLNDTLIGGGLRIGYNLSRQLTIEAEGNIFRRPSADRGRRSQGLFGIKWGRRGEKAGIFAKARPGFMRFNQILSFSRTPGNNVRNLTNVYLALDFGAVVEVYPTRRSIIRFDFGDTIVRYTNRQIEGFEPGAIPIRKTNYGHNFQFSAGVGFRF